MESLALETLQVIFAQLPQHDLGTCALVCWGWYLAVREPLYRAIHLYTTTQIKRLLTPEDRRWGIRQLTLHCHVPDTVTWTRLQQMCPNVTRVDILTADQRPGVYGVCCHRRRYPLADGWPFLEHLPVWHKDPATIWIAPLARQLRSLAMDLYFYDDALVLPPHMMSLERLDLYASRGYFRLDERSFNKIHAACPQLRSLSLTSFQLCLPSTPPCQHYPLTSLTLAHVSMAGGQDSYTWLGDAYPELQTLRLQNVRVTAPARLITHQCSRLTCLEIEDTNDYDNENKRNQLWAELNRWLAMHPLARFHWTHRHDGKEARLPSFVSLTSLALTLPTWHNSLSSVPLPGLTVLTLEFPTRQVVGMAGLISVCPNLTCLTMIGGVLRGAAVCKIREWTLADTRVVGFETDIGAICRACPRLQRLALRHLRCHLGEDEGYVPAKEAGQRFVLGLNLSGLCLEELDVANLWYESMMMADPRYTKRVAVQQIHVHQLASSLPSKSYRQERLEDDLWANKVQVHITCKSIDRIHIRQLKYC